MEKARKSKKGFVRQYLSHKQIARDFDEVNLCRE
jgi:hypothetical protein